MHLEIAQQILRPPRQRGDRLGIEARLVDDVGHALATGISMLQQAHVEAAGDRAAADIVRGKAHALLFGKADHVDMKRQPPARAMKFLHRHQAGQDSEPAVVVAAIEDRIVVRADDQRLRGRIGGRVAAHDIADPVDLGRHPGRGHQVPQFRGNRAMRGREIRAGEPVGGVRPLRQPPGQLDDALAERVLPGGTAHAFRFRDHKYALFGRHSTCNIQLASVILKRAERKDMPSWNPCSPSG